MKAFAALVVSALALTVSVGLNGCDPYELELFVPPGATTLQQSQAVIFNTRNGETVVVPFGDLPKVDLEAEFAKARARR